MDAAHKRYVFRTLGFMSAYVAINMAAIRGAFEGRDQWGGYVLSVAVAIPIAAQMWALLALMRDTDEFVRALMAKRFIVASGLAMALFSVWGFLESYAFVTPHIPGWMIYPLFWASYGLVSPFVRTTRP